MSNKEQAKEIFDVGVEASNSRDEIIVQMVQAGVSLNSATIWYKEWAKEAGLSSARVGYKTEAFEHIAGWVANGGDLVDNDQRKALKTELAKKFGVADGTANDYVKAYAAVNNIELPTSNFGANPEDQAKIFNWICDNPDCSKEDFKTFMVEEMERSSGSIDETYRGIVLARKLQEAGITFAT